MTLPAMAAQVDSWNSRSFKACRPWRRRQTSPGHAALQGHGTPASSLDITSALHRVSTRIGMSSSSLAPSPPSPPSTRPDRRSRARQLVASSALPVSVSVSPSPSPSPSPSSSFSFSYLSPSSSHLPIAPRPGSAIAYTYSHPPPSSQQLAASSEDPQPSPPSAPSAPPAKMAASTSSTDTPAPPRNKAARPAPPPLRPANIPLSLKRRRALSDVDGPNTAVLCCKKRRLRRFLITSRLSQPFSQPASHILNRESVAAGDKRFLKLAAIMNARRIRTPQAAASLVPPPMEAVWRAAMANRFRKRILADAALGRPVANAPVQLINNARLTIVPAATAASMAAVRAGAGAGAHAASPHVASPLAAPRMLKPDTLPASLPPSLPASPPSSRPASPPDSARDHASDHASDGARDGARDGACGSSEEDLDYPRPSLDDDDDDDSGCAFPTSEHGSRYEADDYDDEDDRPADEVYADFSVLFSSSSDDTDWGSGGEEGLDDYMDELDGIAHLPR